MVPVFPGCSRWEDGGGTMAYLTSKHDKHLFVPNFESTNIIESNMLFSSFVAGTSQFRQGDRSSHGLGCV